MENHQARIHVLKGLFALFTGVFLFVMYENLSITSWLRDVDNVLVTMMVVIIPLIATTEMIFQFYQLMKGKLEDISQ